MSVAFLVNLYWARMGSSWGERGGFSACWSMSQTTVADRTRSAWSFSNGHAFTPSFAAPDLRNRVREP